MAKTVVLALVWFGLATPVRAQEGAIPDLRAPRVDVRRQAAIHIQGATRAEQRQALPILIDVLMTEKDGQVRLAVLDALTALGPDAAAAVPVLLHTLRTNYGGGGQEESHQDYRSALALAAVGQPAVEGLRGLLTERKESVRAEAIMALGRIGSDSAPAVGDLIPMLGDKSERIRREAVLALGRIGSAAVPLLLAASAGSDAAIRARAIDCLGYLAAPEDRVIRLVLDSATDVAPRVRAAALGALARFPVGDERVLPIVRNNLQQHNEGVRLAAVNLAAGRRGLLGALVPDLAGLLLAEDDGVARHAAFLLRQVGAAAVPRLIEALPDPRSRIEPIAEALAGIGRPALPALDRALEAPEPRVRRGAALALGQARPAAPGTVSRLTGALSDPDPTVRADLLTAVGALGPKAVEAVPTIRPLLGDASPTIRLRVVAILARSAPRDDRLLADLTLALDDADPKVQAAAVDVLRALGPLGRKPLPRVVELLGSPDPEIRLAGALFVESHGPAGVEAVPALTTLLGDPGAKIRTTAVQTLGKLGKAAQPAFPALAARLGDENVGVREVTALALGNLELPADALRADLARALRDDKSEVRRAAMKSVGRLGPGGVAFIPDILPLAGGKEPPRSVDRLLRPFERTGPDVGSLPELVRLLDHDQVAVRLLAIKFLGLAGGNAREAIPALERIRDDPNAEVRHQARTACDQIRQGLVPRADKPLAPS